VQTYKYFSIRTARPLRIVGREPSLRRRMPAARLRRKPAHAPGKPADNAP